MPLGFPVYLISAAFPADADTGDPDLRVKILSADEGGESEGNSGGEAGVAEEFAAGGG